MLSLTGHPREDVNGFFVNFVVNQGDSPTHFNVASARDLDRCVCVCVCVCVEINVIHTHTHKLSLSHTRAHIHTHPS